MTRAGSDNLGALRVFAAGLVILGHSFVMVGAEPPAWFGVGVHTLAVRVFFVISGYLVAGSWIADPAPLRFAARRVLRIMPALIVTVVLTVVVVGPMATVLPWRAYAADAETRTYLWNALLAPYYALPGVFQDGRPFTAVNGSLWSLPVEAAMYVLLPFYAGRRLVAVVAVLALAAAFAFTVVWPGQVQPVVYWTSIPFALRYASDFVLGAGMRVWRLERWLNLQGALAVLAVLAVLPPGPAVQAALLAGVPYIVLAFGLAAPAVFGRVGRRNDVSYGLYLWGGPVGQVGVSLLGVGLGGWGLAVWTLPVAGGLAWASWRLVERPCLAWKPRRAVALTAVRQYGAAP